VSDSQGLRAKVLHELVLVAYGTLHTVKNLDRDVLTCERLTRRTIVEFSAIRRHTIWATVAVVPDDQSGQIQNGVHQLLQSEQHPGTDLGSNDSAQPRIKRFTDQQRLTESGNPHGVLHARLQDDPLNNTAKTC